MFEPHTDTVCKLAPTACQPEDNDELDYNGHRMDKCHLEPDDRVHQDLRRM